MYIIILLTFLEKEYIIILPNLVTPLQLEMTRLRVQTSPSISILTMERIISNGYVDFLRKLDEYDQYLAISLRLLYLALDKDA